MQATAAEEAWQRSRVGRRSRLKVVRPRFLPEPTEKEGEHVGDDKVHHHGHDDLACAIAGLQETRDRAPGSSPDAGRHQRARDGQGRRHPAQSCAGPVGRHRPGKELAFRPDVPHAATDSDRNGQAREDQGGRLHQGFDHGRPGAEGASHHSGKGHEHVYVRRSDQRSRYRQGSQQGNDERADLGRSRHVHAPFQPPMPDLPRALSGLRSARRRPAVGARPFA